MRGLAVFAECLAGELACGDQRRRTGSGSALEVLRDDALHKFYMFTLLYFTSHHIRTHVASSVMHSQTNACSIIITAIIINTISTYRT